MRKATFLRAALALAAIAVLALTAGVSRASAQPGGGPYDPPVCDPCDTWWVDVNYVFPPCSIPVPIDIYWDNGQWTHDLETSDGHHTYPVPPPVPARATSVTVLGVAIPLNGPPVWVPYPCSDPAMPGMCLRVEVRCNPCLEIKLHLEPCP